MREQHTCSNLLNSFNEMLTSSLGSILFAWESKPDVFLFFYLALTDDSLRPVELLKKMDIPGCAGVFNYFAGSAYHILGESSLSSPNFLNVTVRQPYGVVGLIIPWNVGGQLSFACHEYSSPCVGSGDHVRVQSGSGLDLREHCGPQVI